MANKDAAFGAKPIRHLTGGVIRATEYKIVKEYGANVFTGVSSPCICEELNIYFCISFDNSFSNLEHLPAELAKVEVDNSRPSLPYIWL